MLHTVYVPCLINWYNSPPDFTLHTLFARARVINTALHPTRVHTWPTVSVLAGHHNQHCSWGCLTALPITDPPPPPTHTHTHTPPPPPPPPPSPPPSPHTHNTHTPPPPPPHHTHTHTHTTTTTHTHTHHHHHHHHTPTLQIVAAVWPVKRAVRRTHQAQRCAAWLTASSPFSGEATIHLSGWGTDRRAGFLCQQ